jgi:hypothetical protein
MLMMASNHHPKRLEEQYSKTARRPAVRLRIFMVWTRRTRIYVTVAMLTYILDTDIDIVIDLEDFGVPNTVAPVF